MLECFFEILKELEEELEVKTVKLSFLLLNSDVLQVKIDIYIKGEVITFSRCFSLIELEMWSNIVEQAVFYNWKHEIIKHFGNSHNEN